MTLPIAIIAALVVFVIWAYNKLIKLRNQVKEAWADIDVQLKRRYNLIPNIVETVKGYASHEENVLVQVTEARAQAINATNVQEQGQAENMLSGALKSLFAVAENYPQLKANENFLQLQNELVDTEDKIQSSRRFYNSIVRDYNTAIQQFPTNLLANAFKFKVEEFFEIENEEQRENVEVSFNKEGTHQDETPKAETPPVAEAPKAEVAPVVEVPKEEKTVEIPVEEKAPASPVEEVHPDQAEMPLEGNEDKK